MQPFTFFYCYAREDKDLRDELDKHLNPLKRLGFIQSWHDLDISPGEEWEKEIDVHLGSAQVILLLISPDFIASDYCYGKEMQMAINRHYAGDAVVIPIIMRPSAWKGMPFSKLQMLPSGAKPVTLWSDRDEAFEDIVKSIRTLIEKLIAKLPVRTIEFSIQQGDITEFDADVLGLKYAQEFYGLDLLVARKLLVVGTTDDNLRPAVGQHCYVDTLGCIDASHALFVGIPDLFDLTYQDIREFSYKVLDILADEDPSMRHIVMTIHGAGFGLDEVESLLAQFAGYLDAIQKNRVPQSLERITIVEFDNNRVVRLGDALEQHLRHAEHISKVGGRWAYQIAVQPQNVKFFSDEVSSTFDLIGNAGQEAEVKPYILVIAPVKNEMEDVFYYGIQKPTHDADFLCERVSDEAFMNALEQVKKKMDAAVMVVVEMSEAKPIAYFGAGYAWGKGIPAIILVKEGQEIHIDSKNWKHIQYTSIRILEENLSKELNALYKSGL
jgi:hypothetical protein